MTADHCWTGIFTQGSFIKGDLTWGWQCFGCGGEEFGFATATAASEAADEHAGGGVA